MPVEQRDASVVAEEEGDDSLLVRCWWGTSEQGRPPFACVDCPISRTSDRMGRADQHH